MPGSMDRAIALFWSSILHLNHSLLKDISLLLIDFSPEAIKFHPSMPYSYNLSALILPSPDLGELKE